MYNQVNSLIEFFDFSHSVNTFPRGRISVEERQNNSR